MKKIAFLIPSLAQAGSEKSFIAVANSVNEKGYDVSVIVFSSLLHCADQLDKSIKLYKLKGKTSNPFFLLKIKFTLKNINPDIVFGWSTYANLSALLLSPSKPKRRVIISERVYFSPRLKLEQNKITYLKYKFVLGLVKKFYKRADLITVNSLANLRFMKLFIGKGPKYELLPNSIDLSSINQKKEAFIVNDKGSYDLKLLAVGRLEKQKGFDILLKAINLIKDKIVLKLLIIGDGNEMDNLKKLSKELRLENMVAFEGFKENPYPYYKWADIFILSSRIEGFPNVLLEAMACGKACIASDCKTGPGEITDMGKLGLLYPVDDFFALASAILKLVERPDLRSELGIKAQEKISNKYDYNRMKNLYISIIR